MCMYDSVAELGVFNSAYFARALASKFEEGVTGIFQYNTDEGSLHAYWRCFQYIYTGEHAEEPAAELNVPGTHKAALFLFLFYFFAVKSASLTSRSQDDDHLSKEIRVYELAHYFDVKGLGEYSLDRFKVKVEKLWVSERFVDCIRDVYASTVDSDCRMRKAVVDITGKHFDELWEKPLQDLMREGGDFAVDLVEQMTQPAPRRAF
ncbi:hypothetical protein LLEC1_07017 [Akanthomyces lecanii]|uniref:BTB domain-containing protein n=1 Tax=Cordyceps confragosa TaxID=2714763 RepID=A0A179ID10_CORDF|nr:hypothetical protein LLEC1_07017 [Akanthomyces lecanii]